MILWEALDKDFKFLAALGNHHLHQTPMPAESFVCIHDNIDDWLLLWEQERVLLLVLNALNTVSFPKPSWYSRLQSMSKPWVLRQLLITHVSHQVHGALKTQNIPHVFLKGCALNSALWGQKLVRMSGDIDILVPPAHLLSANTALNQLGFTSNESLNRLARFQRFPHTTTRKDWLLFKDGTPLVIELHWKTSHTELVLDKKGHWQQSLQFEKTLPVLSDVNNALYLCFHAAMHGWSRKLWLIDIAQFFHTKNITIAKLRRRAKEQRLSNKVEEALYLMRHWLHANCAHQLPAKAILRLHKQHDYQRQPTVPGAPFSSKLVKLLMALKLNQQPQGQWRQMKINLRVSLLVFTSFWDRLIKSR